VNVAATANAKATVMARVMKLDDTAKATVDIECALERFTLVGNGPMATYICPACHRQTSGDSTKRHACTCGAMIEVCK